MISVYLHVMPHAGLVCMGLSFSIGQTSHVLQATYNAVTAFIRAITRWLSLAPLSALRDLT